MLFSMSTRIEKAELPAKMGYDAIDVDLAGVNREGDLHNNLLDGENWLQRVDAERERCNQMGLKINSVHMPYKYQLDDPNYSFHYEMMCKALIAADRMGAEWAVMHIKPTEQLAPLVKQLLSDTNVQHVKIAIENCSNKLMKQVFEVHDILKEEGYPVGICLDLGHCHMNTSGIDYDVVEKIYELGDRIKMLHIHDNFRMDDTHAVPFGGNIPWEKVMCALKDVGYTGAFNYEIAMQWIPEVLREAFVGYCNEVAKYLMKIFDEHVPKA